MAFFGGLAIPFGGRSHINFGAKTLLEQRSHHGHGTWIVRIGQWFGDATRLDIVLVFKEGDGLFECCGGKCGLKGQTDGGQQAEAFPHVIAVTSLVIVSRAAAASFHMSSDGRMKSGLCGKSVERPSALTGSNATAGTAVTSCHQAMIGSP